MKGTLAIDDALGNAGEVLDVLGKVLCGWRFEVTPDNDEPPLIRIFMDPGGIARTSPWTEGGRVVLVDPVDAVCDLLPDLERARIAASHMHGKPLLALHAAAVEFPGGLSVFPATHESGKSTLAVALAGAGRRVFSDDIMALETDTDGSPPIGVAPGFMPRLRLPLPGDLDVQSRDFIKNHAGPASARFQYVMVDKALQAPLGERASITRLVLLRRASNTRPCMEPASDSEALKHTVLQSFGREVPALEMLDHLHGIVRSADCHILHYTRAEDAVTLLQNAFS